MRLTCCLLGQGPTLGKTPGTKIKNGHDRDERGGAGERKGREDAVLFMGVFIVNIGTHKTLPEFEDKAKRTRFNKG